MSVIFPDGDGVWVCVELHGCAQQCGDQCVALQPRGQQPVPSSVNGDSPGTEGKWDLLFPTPGSSRPGS